ncbi:unnamed protein product [Strongylus vulgaris]|uniref:Uncharacterized protein n=1 Tax=Strongylus vulgaris TaxID=40348 RepID=A0A3P7KET5_STRVU|nr:unnamed protein product [Strongylus vulgaris]
MKIGRDADTIAPLLNAVTPSRKRKEPFASPLKRLMTPTKSPSSKIMKLGSPVLPLSNITNASPGTSDSYQEVASSQRRKLRKSAFHYRYPTENLPNRVYERFVLKFKAKKLAEKQSSIAKISQPPSSSKKKLEDFCVRSGGEIATTSKLGRTRLPSVTEFGNSVCSKMVPEEDRIHQNSPRKLTVKLTPLKSRPAQLKGIWALCSQNSIKFEIVTERQIQSFTLYYLKILFNENN